MFLYENISIAHIEIVFLFLEIPNGAYTTLSQFWLAVLQADWFILEDNFEH